MADPSRDRPAEEAVSSQRPPRHALTSENAAPPAKRARVHLQELAVDGSISNSSAACKLFSRICQLPHSSHPPASTSRCDTCGTMATGDSFTVTHVEENTFSTCPSCVAKYHGPHTSFATETSSAAVTSSAIDNPLARHPLAHHLTSQQTRSLSRVKADPDADISRHLLAHPLTGRPTRSLHRVKAEPVVDVDDNPFGPRRSTTAPLRPARQDAHKEFVDLISSSLVSKVVNAEPTADIDTPRHRLALLPGRRRTSGQDS